MIIGAENSCTTGSCEPTSAVERGIRASARSLLAASTGPSWCYRIDGTEHFNFTDYAAYYLAAPLRSLVPLGGIDGRRGLSVTGAYVAAFLAHTVRRHAEPLLSGQPRPPHRRARPAQAASLLQPVIMRRSFGAWVFHACRNCSSSASPRACSSP